MPSQNHLCKERRYGGGNKETIGLCCKRQKESEQLNPGQAADLRKCVGYPEETHLGETNRKNIHCGHFICINEEEACSYWEGLTQFWVGMVFLSRIGARMSSHWRQWPQKQGWHKRHAWQRFIWETMSSAAVICRRVPKLCTLHGAWREGGEYWLFRRLNTIHQSHSHSASLGVSLALLMIKWANF